jgi:hypothetical protein
MTATPLVRSKQEFWNLPTKVLFTEHLRAALLLFILEKFIQDTPEPKRLDVPDAVSRGFTGAESGYRTG